MSAPMDSKSFLDAKKIFKEGQEYFKKGLFEKSLEKFNTVFTRFKNEDLSEGMAEILYQIAMVHKKLGNFQDSIINLKESLELYHFLENEDKIALILHALGLLHAEIGENEIAWRYYEEASVLYQSTGNDNGLGAILFEIGNINLKRNELVEAWENFQQALEYQEKNLDNKIGIAKCKYALALIAMKENEITKAIDLEEEASNIFDEIDHIDGKIKIKALRGIISLKRGDYNKSEQEIQECMRLIAQRYIKPGINSAPPGVIEKQEEVQVLISMGSLLVEDSTNIPEIGKTLNIKAFEFFEEAAILAENINHKSGMCQALFNMGLILFDRGDTESDIESLVSASVKFNRVLDIAKEINDNELLTRTLLLLGTCYRKLNQFEEGLNYLQDCYVISRRLDYPNLIIRTLLEKFKIFFQLGRLDEALHSLESCLPLIKSNNELTIIQGDVYLLFHDFYREIGEIERSQGYLKLAGESFKKSGSKKGIIRVLQEIANSNKEQGYFNHAISYLEKIQDLYTRSHLLIEASTTRIEIAELFFLKGDLENALKRIENEISFLSEIGLPGSTDLIIQAKIILFRIAKSKGELLTANDIFKDVLEHYKKSRKISDLIEVFTTIAYESLENGDLKALKNIVNKIWKILKKAPDDPRLSRRMFSFLHIFGLIQRDEGKYQLARNYFNECLSSLKRNNIEPEQGIVIAQLADLSFIEGKPESLNLFKESLKLLPLHGYREDIAKINLKIGKICYRNGNLDKSIDFVLNALKLLEDNYILSQEDGMKVKNQEKIHFYTSMENPFKLLASLYLKKYLDGSDERFLKRSWVALQFQKIHNFHEDFFEKRLLDMYICSEKQKYLDIDEKLRHQANMKDKIVQIILNKLEFQTRLLMDPNTHRDFVKTNIDSLTNRLETEEKELKELLLDLKKNRTYLMECKDPGSFIPFIGFNLLKSIQKILIKHPGIMILDHAIFPETSTLAIFTLYDDKIEIYERKIEDTFLNHLQNLNDALLRNNHAEIVFSHQKLTEWLLPRAITKNLGELGFKYPFICPDRLIDEVYFNLLGDENNIANEFVFFHIPHLLHLKRIMEDNQSQIDGDNSIHTLLLFPDMEDPQTIDEFNDVDSYYEKIQKQGKKISFELYSGEKANYSALQFISNANPKILHYAGKAFLLPRSSFLTMHDRSFFLDKMLDFDLKEGDILFSCSSSNEFLASPKDIMITWRLLSFNHLNNTIYATSNFGFSGRFFSYFYERIYKGDSIGEAYHNCVLYFNKIQEISPLARATHVLIGNPFWKIN